MLHELCCAGSASRFAVTVVRFVAPWSAAFALGALCGCYPTLPPAFGEGTDVLAPGKVGLTVMGAGGYAATSPPAATPPQPTITTGGGGLEARLRVGVGAKSEIGLAGYAGIGSAASGDPPFSVGAMIGYKIAPVEWLALVANAGIIDFNAASVVAFGGDLAAIVAPYTARDGSQLYTGARGSFSIPMLLNSGTHAVDEAVTVPVGYALQVGQRTKLFFEGGFVLGFTQLTNESSNTTRGFTSYGGYGLVGFRQVFN